MNKPTPHEQLLENLFDQAIAKYEKTGSYDLDLETRTRIRQESKSELTADQQRIVEAWYGDLCVLTDTEERFLYLHAMRDCASLLRWLGVLI